MRRRFSSAIIQIIASVVSSLHRGSAAASSPLGFVASIDMMKMSKDNLSNQASQTLIDQMIGVAKAQYVTHIAVSTSYDGGNGGAITNAQATAYLTLWVNRVHAAGLKVWLRSHFNGWEGNYGVTANMTSAQYLSAFQTWLTANAPLFQSGDIVDGCPEPENGAYWNSTYGANALYQASPNSATNDYNTFIVNLKTQADTIFSNAGVSGVITGIRSMSGTIAKDTTKMYQSSVVSLGYITSDSYLGQSDTTAATAKNDFAVEVNAIISRAGGYPYIIGETGFSSNAPSFSRTTLTTAITTTPAAGTVETWTVGDTSQTKVNDILKIDAESVYVTAITNGTTLSVSRGWSAIGASTPATHAASVAIQGYPTDSQQDIGYQGIVSEVQTTAGIGGINFWCGPGNNAVDGARLFEGSYSGYTNNTTTYTARTAAARIATLFLNRAGAATGKDALQRRTIAEINAWAKQWLKPNNVKGYVGEFGVPNAAYGVAADAPLWAAVSDAYLTEADYLGISSTQWASGDNWPNYNMGVYTEGTQPSGSDINTAQSLATTAEAHPDSANGFHGQNVSGWEGPGGGYTNSRTSTLFTTSAASFTYLAGRGVKTVRLPMQWEHLQPTLLGALDTTALSQLNTMIQAAATAGIRVSLDLHNYARYCLADNATVYVMQRVGGNLNAQHLCDFWTKLATWVRADPTRNSTVYAYDIMNEPHDLVGEAGTYTIASTIYDFETAAQVTPWGAAATRDTTVFHGGAASMALTPGSGGGQFLDGTVHSYASGTNLRAYVYIPAGTAGYLSCGWRVQASATGSSNGQSFTQYSQYSNNSDQQLTAGAWNLIEWANVPTFLLANIGQLGFYFGGAGVTGSVKVNVDDITVGAVAGVYNANQVWEYCTQQALSAIRYGNTSVPVATTGSVVDTRLVMIPGANYSSLTNWTGAHPTPWITDPSNNYAYEAHHYFDATSGYQRSGTYNVNNGNLPYSTENSAAISSGF